jgi:HSP20 family protein
MNLWVWRPGQDPLREMGQQMSRLLNFTLGMVERQFWQSGQPFLACNFYETDTEYFVLVPLPGVAAEDLELQVVGQKLHLRGERKRTEAVADEMYRRQERWHGHWSRSIQLPDNADQENVAASLENGILLVKVGKISLRSTRTLPIKVNSTHAAQAVAMSHAPEKLPHESA